MEQLSYSKTFEIKKSRCDSCDSSAVSIRSWMGIVIGFVLTCC